ncbi:MAG: hypothetical protein AB3N17_09945 [Tateyamaria sp.]
MNIHALWCHPRSVSTAFERIHRARGDLTVLHEPFMYHHYLTTTDRLFPDFVPEPGHPTTYDGIRALIRGRAREGPVFFKDMAYYVAEALPKDMEFAGQMTHAFLIRDPVEAALSYAKRDPGFTRTELGHDAQYRLYHALAKLGHRCLVITADQLRSDPKATLARYWSHAGLTYKDHAFEWDDRVPDEWRSVQDWHSAVLQSSTIKMPETADSESELNALGSPYTEYADHHMPFYAELKDIAEAQAHQK